MQLSSSTSTSTSTSGKLPIWDVAVDWLMAERGGSPVQPMAELGICIIRHIR